MSHSKKKSIYRQVLLLISGLFLSCLLWLFASIALRKYIDSQNNGLMIVSSCLSELNVNIRSLNGDLTQYVKKGYLDTGEFTTLQDIVLDTGEKIKGYLNEKEYNRNSIDLYNTIDTYNKICSKLTQDIYPNEYLTIDDTYKQCELIYEFIQNRMNDVYLDIQRQFVITQIQQKKIKRLEALLDMMSLTLVILIPGTIFSILVKKIVIPINDLSKRATLFFDRGDSQSPTTIPSIQEDEISELNNSIYEMQKRICEQFEILIEKKEVENELNQERIKNAETARWMKDTQLKNLQSRINPHFLFNTINIIDKMAFLEHAEKTSEMLETFAQYLRYNLNNLGKVINIEEEEQNVRDYIKIQKIRFGKRIDFSVSVEADVKRVKIPSLILQPLIENSLIHGVGMYTDNGLIILSIQKDENNKVIINELDNGMGMTQEVISELYNKMNSPIWEDSSGSIGLVNVYKRLRLYYNEDVSIHIESQKEKFTKISIIIPFFEES